MTAGAGAVATGAVGAATAQESTLVVNDFEGDPSYPDQNDLENWTGAGSFANGGGTGEVSDGVLRLEYDNAGWFGTNVNQDVGDYSRLEFVVRGDSGGEESHFTLNVGGTQTLLADLTDDSIGTEFSTVAVDLDDLGVSGSVSAVRLNFWQQNSGAIEIDTIRFASGSTSTPPPTETTTEPTETTTEPTPEPGDQTVSVELSDDSIASGGSTEADVVLGEAPGGVSGFDLSVEVSDTSVATIESVSVEGTEFSTVGESSSVSSDGSSATVEAADLSESVPDGTSDVALATVTLSGENPGEAEVSVDVSVNVDRLDDNDGNDIPVSTQGSSLTVEPGETPTADQTVSIELDDSSIEADGSTAADVVLSEAPNGVFGFDLSVAVSDTDVATTDSVSVEDTEFSTVGESATVSDDGSTATVSDDGSTATVEAADLSEAIGEGASDVTLTTLSLSGENPGEVEVSVDVSVDVDRLDDDDDGNDISVDTEGATLTVGSGEPPAGSTVAVELEDSSIAADGSTQAVAVLDSAPDGVSGYDLSVAVSDTSVATIDSIGVEGTEFSTVGDSATVSDDGSSATVEAADLSEAVQGGASDVALATVTLAGEAEGSADVSVDVDRLDDDEGNDVSVSTESAMLSVRPGTGGDGPTVSVDLSSQSIPSDGSTEAALTLAEAPDGVSGYDLSVAVSDTGVATIEEIATGSGFTSPGDSTSVTDDGSSATLSAADLSESVEAGASDVTLGALTLDAQGQGDVEVSVSVDEMDDDNGQAVSASTESATLSVGSGPGGDYPIGVDFSMESVAPDGTAEAAITLDEAPDGVSGFELSIAVSDTGVATIESVASGSGFTSPGDSTSVSSDGSSATISGADLSESVQDGATDVRLGTVTLATHATGETIVDASVEAMDDDDGGAMDIGAGRATLSVGEDNRGSGGVEPVNGVVPQDNDGDGLYEDLNGNGQVEFTDVIKFDYQRNDPAIQNNSDAYDFNENGRLDLDDVVSLFREMAENGS